LSPLESVIPRLIIPRVILQAIVPLSPFSIPGQTGCPSNFLLRLLLDLFDGLLRGFISLPHHVDFSVALGVIL
jgi:hypothetical protein